MKFIFECILACLFDIGGLDPSTRKYAVEVRPSENVAFFHSKLLLDNCKFPIINNERLVSKMEGRTIFLEANEAV